MFTHAREYKCTYLCAQKIQSFSIKTTRQRVLTGHLWRHVPRDQSATLHPIHVLHFFTPFFRSLFLFFVHLSRDLLKPAKVFHLKRATNVQKQKKKIRANSKQIHFEMHSKFLTNFKLCKKCSFFLYTRFNSSDSITRMNNWR